MMRMIQPFYLIGALTFLIINAVIAQSDEVTPDSDGYIHHWLMLGPIPLEAGETGAEAVQFNVIRRESMLQPSEGETQTVAGYELTWQKHYSESEVFDFNIILEDRIENAIGYLVAYVESPKEIRNVTLLAGGNDQTRVYFNGEEVSTSTEPRALTKDSDMASGLTLKQGINTVILKVVNEVGNWQGCLRFMDEGGQPITEIVLKDEG